LAQLGLLLRYHERPSVLALLGVAACGLVGWFAQPLVMALLSPLLLIYYLSAAHRHSFWWHLPLVLGLAVAVGAKALWVQDWVTYWWVRATPCLEGQETQVGLWEPSVWGDHVDRALAVAAAVLGGVGAFVLYLSGRRPAARLLGLGTVGLFALVVAGLRSHVLYRLGACQLLPAALLFASLPAAFAVAWVLGRLR